jgi:hypothetical protein
MLVLAFDMVSFSVLKFVCIGNNFLELGKKYGIEHEEGRSK